MARRIREEATDDRDDTVAVERFTRKGGRFVRGRAAVTGSRTVAVGGQEFRASRGLVLATGTQSAVPLVDGLDGFIKLIADTDAGMLIGATSAGPVGGEVLGALAVVVHARVPVTVLSQMIYAYPTFHRAISSPSLR